MVTVQKNNGLIYLCTSVSIFFGVLLQVLPLATEINSWRPQFLLLIVIFWLVRSPFHHGITFAWLTGLLLDIFMGELIGRYAIIFALCAYLLQLLRQRLHNFSIFHQTFLVFLLVWLSQCLLYSITLIFRASWIGGAFFIPALTSALVWPALAWLLNKLLRIQQLGQTIFSKS